MLIIKASRLLTRLAHPLDALHMLSISHGGSLGLAIGP